jgi:integrase
MASSHNSGRSKLGNVREVRPGVWKVRVSSGYRKDGSQRTVSETVRGTEADAQARVVQLSAEMGRCLSTGDPMTLDTYFWAYFLPTKEASTTKANANTYRSIYRQHIADHFGQWSLADIGNVEIQAWINALPPQSAPNYVRALRAILNQAHFDHLKDDAPMADYRYKMPKGRRATPLPVWGAVEVGMAMRRLRGDQLYPLWLVMVGAGLSRSEALALDWESVAWSECLMMDGQRHWTAIITVEHAFTADDGMKEPKNDRRYRRVPMQPPFSDALHECASAGPICQSRKHTKDGWKPSGNRLTPCYVPRRWKALFEPGEPLHGLPFVEIGRMRATYSTLMQRAGVDRTIINAMQGRTDNSPVLYSNYLNPGQDTFVESAASMSSLVSAV